MVRLPDDRDDKKFWWKLDSETLRRAYRAAGATVSFASATRLRQYSIAAVSLDVVEKHWHNIESRSISARVTSLTARN